MRRGAILTSLAGVVLLLTGCQNPVNGDGGLDLSSDAANAVTTDYTGTTRTTPFSIGAYEND